MAPFPQQDLTWYPVFGRESAHRMGPIGALCNLHRSPASESGLFVIFLKSSIHSFSINVEDTHPQVRASPRQPGLARSRSENFGVHGAL